MNRYKTMAKLIMENPTLPVKLWVNSTTFAYDHEVEQCRIIKDPVVEKMYCYGDLLLNYDDLVSTLEADGIAEDTFDFDSLTSLDCINVYIER